MERKLNYTVFFEDDAFVARCLDVEVTSDRSTEQDAVINLKEALELYFLDRAGMLADLPARTYRFGTVAVRV